MTRRQLIAHITGLNFCGRDCGCGANSQLWFFPVGGGYPKPWVPVWMNGAATEEIWEWLVESGKVRRRVSVTESRKP